jgi:acyl-CoA synthetase (AMP-forming)/AMP-acid ligase II
VVRVEDGRSGDFGDFGDEELAAFCRERLARHKVPKLWHRIDAFPLTGSGKVMKHVLREQLLSKQVPGEQVPGEQRPDEGSN